MSILTNHSRRSFLRSSSACLALPVLDTFAAPAKAAIDQPKRMVFLGQGFGFLPEFYPTESGKFSEIGLSDGMSPIKAHQDDISLLGNLVNVGAYKPHEGSETFLTGANQRGKNSISCDQVAAQHLCKDTRHPHLPLSTKEKRIGHGKTMLSMAYNKDGNSIPGLDTSLELYAKLFVANENKEQLMARIKTESSVLDSLEVNAKTISRRIAKTDKEKLEEYFQTIRQVELALKRQIEWADKNPKPSPPFDYPEEVDGQAEVKLMFEMIALAFQTDQTRVMTYMMPSQSVLSSMGITIPVHSISHYNASKERRDAGASRDKKCMELLAYLLDRLKEKKGLDGQSVYDSCVVSYGTNIKAGHSLNGLPLILSGGGIGKLRLGESIKLPEATPLANVWLTLLQQVGVPLEQFSHSTRALSELIA